MESQIPLWVNRTVWSLTEAMAKKTHPIHQVFPENADFWKNCMATFPEEGQIKFDQSLMPEKSL